MNRAFRNVGRIMLALFALLAVSATYWSVWRGPSLTKRLDNPRRLAQELHIQRGRILSSNGATLAQTDMTADGAVRHYAYPGLAPLVGYWSATRGVSGLEAAYNDQLRGMSGHDSWSATVEDLLHKPHQGHDLITTLDMDLQQAADEALGNRRGAIVILDPNTGDLLASVSHPYYDPNHLTDEWEQIRDNPDHPLLNRTVQGLYPPGSVLKTVTLATALADNVTHSSEVFTDSTGLFIVEGFPIHDHNHPGISTFDLPHAFGYSCNVVFAQLGLRLGAERFKQGAQDFGFGQTLPVPVESAASSVGRDVALFEQPGLATAAFGQGEVLVTPMQMALVAAAIANGGLVPRVRVVREVRGTDGTVLQRIRPQTWRRAVRGGVAQEVREAMIVAASDGWARSGTPPGIATGGKTGTAQVGGTALPHAWFIGFAPAIHPQIALAVLVENSGQGGAIAAPIARRLFEAALR